MRFSAFHCVWMYKPTLNSCVIIWKSVSGLLEWGRVPHSCISYNGHSYTVTHVQGFYMWTFKVLLSKWSTNFPKSFVNFWKIVIICEKYYERHINHWKILLKHAYFLVVSRYLSDVLVQHLSSVLYIMWMQVMDFCYMTLCAIYLLPSI